MGVIKNIWAKVKFISFSPSLDEKKLKDKTPVITQSVANTLNQHTQVPIHVLLALDQIWSNNKNKVDLLKQGNHLWHSGTIGHSQPIDSSKSLWTTNDPSKTELYNDWAKYNSRNSSLIPYLVEFSTNKNLNLANFNKASLGEFTILHCKSDHKIMKKTLLIWIIRKKIDGIISVNGCEDEVVIAKPANDLDQINITLL